MTCTFCRDQPSPGYQCSRCGTYTRPMTNKGPAGQAEDLAAVAEGKQMLADLHARRQAKADARAAQDRLYAELRARHTEHPQSRGSSRRLLSRP